MAKHEGAAGRIALVIHLVRWAEGEADESSIDEVSMRAGIEIALPAFTTHIDGSADTARIMPPQKKESATKK